MDSEVGQSPLRSLSKGRKSVFDHAVPSPRHSHLPWMSGELCFKPQQESHFLREGFLVIAWIWEDLSFLRAPACFSTLIGVTQERICGCTRQVTQPDCMLLRGEAQIPFVFPATAQGWHTVGALSKLMENRYHNQARFRAQTSPIPAPWLPPTIHTHTVEGV